jgi:hypothetical protein
MAREKQSTGWSRGGRRLNCRATETDYPTACDSEGKKLHETRRSDETHEAITPFNGVEDLLQFKCGVPPIRLLCARTFCDRQTSEKDAGGRQDQFVIESVVGPSLPPSVPQWALPHNYPHSMEAMLLFREGDGDTRYFCVVQKYEDYACRVFKSAICCKSQQDASGNASIL